MKQENKLNINDFWKLDGNKVIHCKNSTESKLLLEVFNRMKDQNKIKFSNYGYSYLKHNISLDHYGNEIQDRCFDNIEHDFDLAYYKKHTGYKIYEFDDVELTEYLTKEEINLLKNSNKQINDPQLGE